MQFLQHLDYWASTTVAGFGEEVAATQDGFPSPGKREGACFQNGQMHALRLHRWSEKISYFPKAVYSSW